MSAASQDAESFVTINQLRSPMEGHPLPTGLPNMPKPLMTFYRGEPEALGATQIFVGVMSIAFGISISVTCSHNCRLMDLVMYSGVMFWSGIAYIASGSVSVAAAARPTVGKVKSSLVMNTITAILAGVSIIHFAINFISIYDFYGTVCLYNAQEKTCEGRFDFSDFLNGFLAIQLLFVVLMFTIAISSAVFACRMVCRGSFQEATIVIYQTVSPTTDQTDTKAFSSVPVPSCGISGIQEGVKT